MNLIQRAMLIRASAPRCEGRPRRYTRYRSTVAELVAIGLMVQRGKGWVITQAGRSHVQQLREFVTAQNVRLLACQKHEVRA